MSRKPAAQPPVGRIKPDMELRLAYWRSDHRTYEVEWFEDRAAVWFDHEDKGWRASTVNGPQTMRSSAFSTGYKHHSALGFDPRDAVDQLANFLDSESEVKQPAHHFSRWEGRLDLGHDQHRGYGPNFAVNPYEYTLDPDYTCHVVQAGIGFVAYYERHDGRVFVGMDLTAQLAVRTLHRDMTENCDECQNHLVRLPDTNITLPAAYANSLGIY